MESYEQSESLTSGDGMRLPDVDDQRLLVLASLVHSDALAHT